MSKTSSEPSCVLHHCIDTEITATRDTIVQGSVKIIAMDAARKTEDISAALKSKRDSLKKLKTDYKKQIQDDGGFQKPSSKRQMIFQEIMHTYGALEGIKEELTRRGAPFEIDVFDHEHPNAAYKRMTAEKPKSKMTFSHYVLSWYLILSMIIFLLWFLTSNEWKQMWHGGYERATPQRSQQPFQKLR
jgi:hypothetical protein